MSDLHARLMALAGNAIEAAHASDAYSASDDDAVCEHVAALSAALREVLNPPLLQRYEIDAIFDAHQDAPTMSFRYYVTEAIEKKLNEKRAAAIDSARSTK